MDDQQDLQKTRLTGHDLSSDALPDPNPSEGESTGFPQGSETVSVGSRLQGAFGKYRIARVLGEGAMGTVYLAQDEDLQRPVALKLPKLDTQPDGELRERFFVEARAAASLRHTNLCPVYEVGELNGSCYLAMAYIDGRPLSDFVSPDHPLPPDQVASIIARLADGLAHAHARGVVHRDLKPSNVIIDPQREPILTDFGLARQSDAGLSPSNSDAARLTSTGMILGSPAYMSPEQATGNTDQIGPQSDVYSLGVMFYELLTGRLPFEGSIAEVLAQVLKDPPTPPSTHRPGLDPELESICMAMLAKRQDARTASASEAAATLNAWLIAQSGSSRSSGVQTLSAFDSSHAIGDARRTQLEEERHLANALLDQGRVSMAARIVDTMAEIDDPRLQEFSTWAREKKSQIQKSRQPGMVVAFTDASGTRFIDIRGRVFRARTIWGGSVAAVILAAALFGWSLFSPRPTDSGVAGADNPQQDVQGALADTDSGSTSGSTPGTTPESPSPAAQAPGTKAPATATRATIPTTKPVTGDEALVFDGHRASVRQARFSRDGRFVVSCSKASDILIWEPATGSLVKRIKGHRAGAWCATFSPDGSIVASGGSDDLIRLWDATTGNPRGVLRGHEDTVMYLDFSPDGRRLISGSDDNTVRLWNLETLLEEHLFNGHSDDVNVVQFTPDGKRCVSGGVDTDLVVWDIENKKQLAVLKGHADTIFGIDICSDGRILATGADDRVCKLWDLETYKEIATLEGHEDEINGVSISANRRLLATGSVDESIKLWDLHTHAELTTLRAHTSLLWDVQFSPEGNRLVSASSDGTSRVWDIPSEVLSLVLKGHSGPVGQVAVNAAGTQLASVSMDQTIRLWDAASGKPGRVLAGHTHWVWAAVYGKHPHTLYSAGDTTLRRWNTNTGKQERMITVTASQARCLALAPNFKYAVIGDKQGIVTTWDLATSKKIRTLTPHDDEVSGVAVSPDGKWIASSGFDGSVLVHVARTGQLHKRLIGSEAPLQSLSIRPDSLQVAAGSHASEVFIWNIADGAPQPGLPETDAGIVYRLTWTPDGQEIITAQDDGTILVRRPGNTEDVEILKGHSKGVLTVVFNRRTGELVSSSFDETIRVRPFGQRSPSR